MFGIKGGDQTPKFALQNFEVGTIFQIFSPVALVLLSASVEDPTRPPVVGRLRSSPVLS